MSYLRELEHGEADCRNRQRQTKFFTIFPLSLKRFKSGCLDMSLMNARVCSGGRPYNEENMSGCAHIVMQWREHTADMENKLRCPPKMNLETILKELTTEYLKAVRLDGEIFNPKKWIENSEKNVGKFNQWFWFSLWHWNIHLLEIGIEAHESQTTGGSLH